MIRTAVASEAARAAVRDVTATNRNSSVDAILTDGGDVIYEAYKAETGTHQPGDKPWHPTPGEHMLCTVTVAAGDTVASVSERVRSRARAAIDRLRAGAQVNVRHMP